MSLRDEITKLLQGARPHEKPTEAIQIAENNRAAIQELQEAVARLAAEVDELKAARQQ
jgi:hypothetical protein